VLWLAGDLDAAALEYGVAAQTLLALASADARRQAIDALCDLVRLHHARLDTRAVVAVRRRIASLIPTDLAARADLMLALHYLPEVSPAQLFAEHLEWGSIASEADVARQSFAPSPPSTELREPSRPQVGASAPPVRIGYFSGKFREYPASRFLAPVLLGHREIRSTSSEPTSQPSPGVRGEGAKRQPLVTLYSDTQKPDAVSQFLAERCDAFIDVSKSSDRELEAILRRDELDLLVDVAGHMDNRRMAVLARHPTRRMLSYINYPNTTGIRGWDYRLTDRIADPPGDADRLHTESLIRMESCAWAYDPAFGLSGPLPDCGPLPAEKNGHITFGVLARPAKLIPEMVQVWAKALAAIPKSRLAVLQAPGIDPKRLLAFLAMNGVDPARIDLLPPGDRFHYLALHRRIDILLDTWPYNGMTATCDALWMGVPVVTLAGDRHVARVGESLLRAVGMTQCVATSPMAYVQAAEGLAADHRELQVLRASLRQRMTQSAISDGTRIAKLIENLASCGSS
jgi:predicted O-linked N-acetylglucosamine transferase (SPINDLY family)